MRTILLVLFCGTFLQATSQRFYFKSFSTSEGLPQSQVTTICQDSTGYLWVGTLGGLSQYNGKKFANYTTENGLLDNKIYSLAWIDSTLFVGHQGGISILNNKQFYTVQLDKSIQKVIVSDIIQFRNQIIVSTNGEGLFILKNGQLEPINLKKGDYLFVRDLLVHQNKLLIASRLGVYQTEDLKSSELVCENITTSVASLSIANEQLVICSFYEGLYYYDLHQKQLTDSFLVQSGYLFNHSFQDSRNNTWIASSSGLLKIQNKHHKLIDNTIGLPLNIVSYVYEDNNKNIWIGTQGKGLVKVGLGDISYFDKTTGLPSDIIISGFQNKNGSYYFGTYDQGAFKTNDFDHYEKIAINSTVWCAIDEIDHKSWFGTKNGLFSLDSTGKIETFHFKNNPPGYKITTFYKINSNSMYIGGSHGLVKYHNGQFSVVGKNSNQLGTIRDISIHNQRIIIGTETGLYQLNKKKNQFEYIGLVNKTVYSLAQTKENKLYIGTEDGLFQLQYDSLVRVRFSSDVASNYINFLSTQANNLIIGTNNGVYIIHEDAAYRQITRVGVLDGLIDPETNLNSSFIDQQGVLWFGTASGLVRLEINQYNKKNEQSKLILSDILLNFETFDYSKQGANMIDGIPQNMSFPYFKNNLQFNIDAIALSNYDELLFQYKLEGLSEQWTPPSKNSTIVLNTLQPGNYTLHVQMLFENGKIVDELVIHFKINQAFYKTWWFFTLLAIFIGLIIYSWVRFKIKREVEKNELKQTAFRARLTTLEQQSLNASMNRHFIFNSLNSIQYFINISDKISANKFLTSFAKLIRKNLDASTEQSGTLSLAEEIDRIELYLSLESMRFKEKFTYAINTNQLDLDDYQIPSMMIQPFVENSIIHGILPRVEQPGHIDIEVRKSGDTISICIKDNGIGIDQSIISKSGYQGDHDSQGMEITLKRIDLIRQISGNEMELLGPRQLVNSTGAILGTEVIIKINVESLDN